MDHIITRIVGCLLGWNLEFVAFNHSTFREVVLLLERDSYILKQWAMTIGHQTWPAWKTASSKMKVWTHHSHRSHHSHHSPYHHTIHSWLTGCSPWRWHSVSGSLPHWRTHFDPCPASCAGYHSVPWQKETKNIGKQRKKPKISHIFKYNFVDTLVLIMLEDVGSHGGS